MGDLDLPQEDMEFLNKVCGPERTPEFQANISKIEQMAASGDKLAKKELEMLLVAESVQDEFRADELDMMLDAATILRHHVPELAIRATIDSTFTSQFAPALEAIMRGAYARGWMAKDKQEVIDEP